MILKVKLSDCIGKNYYEVFNYLEAKKYTHYWFKGGRGSLKSSFACIYVIFSMYRDYMEGKTTHCVALRKVKDTLKDSVFTNLIWAIGMLKLNSLFTVTTSPMKISIGDSTILFRGCANQQDYEKIKSIKFKSGNLKYAIYEELTEFSGIDEILSINQSLFRGTDEAIALYMYNPPPSKTNWVNMECKIERDDRFVHSSTYLEVEPRWLGTIFIKEAEFMKEINLRKYEHMYLAKEIGEGLEIYPNVIIQSITDQQIKTFDKIYRGLDYGFAADASCYGEMYLDSNRDVLYIFDEIYGHGLTNKQLADNIKNKAGKKLVWADSAEPRTTNELNLQGLNIMGAKKGKDSVEHGIKWLSQLVKIIIDRKRCPNIASDFETYELQKDKNNNIIHNYPKEPHGSAMTRYALNELILNKKLIFGGR
jgi:PBSX family phage terminase large subunit